MRQSGHVRGTLGPARRCFVNWPTIRVALEPASVKTGTHVQAGSPCARNVVTRRLRPMGDAVVVDAGATPVYPDTASLCRTRCGGSEMVGHPDYTPRPARRATSNLVLP